MTVKRPGLPDAPLTRAQETASSAIRRAWGAKPSTLPQTAGAAKEAAAGAANANGAARGVESPVGVPDIPIISGPAWPAVASGSAAPAMASGAAWAAEVGRGAGAAAVVEAA